MKKLNIFGQTEKFKNADGAEHFIHDVEWRLLAYIDPKQRISRDMNMMGQV